MVWILLLVLAAVALGIVGTVVNGLLYLLAVGIVAFVIAVVCGALLMRRGGRRPIR